MARLFWFAADARRVDERFDEHARAAALGLKRRLAPVHDEPTLRGAFEDAVRYLDSLKQTQRFREVCSLIEGALTDAEKLSSDLTDEFLARVRGAADERPVRFSFAPSILLCLRYAQEVRQASEQGFPGYEIFYSGLRGDRELIASASLYLDLPVYIESGPPWKRDFLDDDGDPLSDEPKLEISFPPAVFKSENALDLEPSIRELHLPRAIDRGGYDIESVMVAYLCESGRRALTLVSESFLSSPKQSRLATRQRLFDMRCIDQIAELEGARGSTHLISLGGFGLARDQIQFILTRSVRQFVGTVPFQGSLVRNSTSVSIDSLQAAGGTLLPKRYLSKGPSGAPGLIKYPSYTRNPAHFCLADLFDIIRPKSIREDPVGTAEVREISGRNISQFGDILERPRQVCIRSTTLGRFDEQELRPGDVVFAHRGPIGRVAYLSENYLEPPGLWAGQTLFIFRQRKWYSIASSGPYCDPRVLFMYLMTREVKESWRKVSISSRSPAIPIGEVERFMVPKSLTEQRKPKYISTSREREGAPASTSDQVLVEFERYKENCKNLKDVETKLNNGLGQVWKTTWQQT